MSHRRVVRVISYEGKSEWIDRVLERSIKLLGTIFSKHGTVRCIQHHELQEHEQIVVEIRKMRG